MNRNQPMDAGCCEAKLSDTQVELQVQRYEDLSVRLGSSLDRLQNRLTGVLKCPCPTTDKGKGEGGLVPLASAILASNDRMQDNLAWLDSIIDRIAI